MNSHPETCGEWRAIAVTAAKLSRNKSSGSRLVLTTMRSIPSLIARALAYALV